MVMSHKKEKSPSCELMYLACSMACTRSIRRLPTVLRTVVGEHGGSSASRVCSRVRGTVRYRCVELPLFIHTAEKINKKRISQLKCRNKGNGINRRGRNRKPRSREPANLSPGDTTPPGYHQVLSNCNFLIPIVHTRYCIDHNTTELKSKNHHGIRYIRSMPATSHLLEQLHEHAHAHVACDTVDQSRHMYEKLARLISYERFFRFRLHLPVSRSRPPFGLSGKDS
jgi:hypothetical protein